MTSDRAPVTRVGGPDGRGALVAVAAIVVGLLVAVVKPWPGSDARNPGSAAPAPAASQAMAPTVPRPWPSPTPPVSDCQAASGWRVLTIETHADRRTETWSAVDPVSAGAAGDRSIPIIRIFAAQVERLGYCAGAFAGATPELDTEAWRLAAGGLAVALELHRADEGGLRRATDGGLFDPPGRVDGAPGAVWPPGRYVFSVRYGPAPADAAWFGAQVMPFDTPPATTGAAGALPEGQG